MKPKSTLHAFLLGYALLATSTAFAATLYWDNDGTTAGFGTAGGTWDAPTISQWSTSSAGTATPEASATTATTDSLNFGYRSTGLAAGTITVNSTVDSGNLTFASGSGAIVLSGGTLNLAAASTITVTNASNTIESVLQGAATSLTKAGTGTLVLAGSNTYTGTTTIKAGVLRLDFSALAAPTSDIINSGSALSLGGGQLTLTGKASTTNSQNVNGLSLTAGANALTLNANATANPLLLSLGSITRAVGSTVTFANRPRGCDAKG